MLRDFIGSAGGSKAIHSDPWAASLGLMRRTEFDRLVEAEFQGAFAGWIQSTHVLPRFGATAEELIDRGVNLRDVWLALCEEFDVPEARRLGPDE